jgi:HSP20 family protein
MSQLVKKNDSFPGIRNFFNDFFDADRFFSPVFLDISKNVPAVNVKELDTKFELEFSVPGFKKSDFKIEVENGILKVSAEKKEETSEEKKNYTKKEFSYNSISRSFVLPETANENQINAEYKDGILILTVDKKADAPKSSKKEISIS